MDSAAAGDFGMINAEALAEYGKLTGMASGDSPVHADGSIGYRSGTGHCRGCCRGE